MSKVTGEIAEAQKLHEESIQRMDDQDVKIQSLPDDAPSEEIELHRSLFVRFQDDAQRAASTLERLIAIRKAREGLTVGDPEDEKRGDDFVPKPPRSTQNSPLTYRSADKGGQHSFFADLVNGQKGDNEARERLDKHQKEMAVELRDLNTTATTGGGFVPPIYLGDNYAKFARESRPFADTVPTSPLPEVGMAISIPRITTGTTVTHIITQNSTAPAETDLVDATLTVPVVTIAGQQDVSQALFDRAQPSIDQILFADLRAAYDMYLDNQLLNGTGANGQHLGIRQVSGTNTVSYTDASPTAAELTPKLYDGIQKIATNRFAPADEIVLHPRRSAWLASNLSSTFPLFQVGNLMQAAGQQDVGAIINVSGLRVVADANIGILYGAATNEDEIYVVRVSDMHLWEGPLQSRVMFEVGAQTMTVRLQLFAYSAFASGRFPKSITIISGTGNVTPVF